MHTVTELACLLSEAEGEPNTITGLVGELADLVTSPDGEAARELDDCLLDVPWVACAQASPAAEAAVRALLAAAAQCCTAREVFTLCMAALSQGLSNYHAEEAPAAGPGSTQVPGGPAFQLFLLETLQRCLPRIRRRPLLFMADMLNMQLRWAAEVWPSLPLGPADSGGGSSIDGSSGVSGSVHASRQQQPLTVAAAVHSLARLAGSTAEWVRSTGQQQEQQRLGEQEQKAALQLLGTALLQLSSMVLQLPQHLEAATAAVAAAQHQPGSSGSAGAAPAAGSRLPLMRAAAAALLSLPQVLLAAVPVATGIAGASSSSSSSPAAPASPELLQKLAQGACSQLGAIGVDPSNLTLFSATEAAEGAAVAACGAACSPVDAQPQLHAQQLQQQLPNAACLLLDLGAEHQSVVLTLLPLCALCLASARLAGRSASKAAGEANAPPAADCRLAASSPALDVLLSALVAIMSQNPVQLIRSCAHDALHALLDAFHPGARLALLRAMVQMPSTAAAVVALQRLRQEMAAAWGPAAASVGAGAPASRRGDSASSSISGSSSSTGSREASQLWLTTEALGLALPCLQRGAEGGWHDEDSVLAAADVQAAALSLLRWVLLRERSAPRGLLPAQRAQQLLQSDLLPLQACVERLLQVQARGMAGSGEGSSTAATVRHQQQQQMQLESLLAVQRLQEALACVIELLLQA